MSNVDMCEHDWPGSGCKECRAEAMARKITAPSGTPAMPVKAYYHEAPNEYGGLNKSVGLEVRKQFNDAPLVLEADALARIACLEGEIAKRDGELAACRVAVENCDLFRARIAELESRYQRDVYGLNNEGDPIGGDPAGGYANDNARLRTELAALKAQDTVGEVVGWYRLDRPYEMTPYPSVCATWHRLGAPVAPLYSAPVSEAKAHGVVKWPEADEIMQMAFEEGQPADDASGYCFELEEFDLFIERLMSDVARLNAAPVQQVVPDASTKMQWPEIVALVNEVLGCEAHKYPCERGSIGHEMTGINFNSLARIIDRVRYAAAPAAPAADAGLVEALRELAEQFREAWPDHTGKYHFLIGAGLSIAASRAQGVV